MQGFRRNKYVITRSGVLVTGRTDRLAWRSLSWLPVAGANFCFENQENSLILPGRSQAPELDVSLAYHVTVP